MADATPIDTPLNAADQTLVFALTYLTLQVTEDEPREALMLDAVQFALPHVTQDHPMIQPLLEFAESLVHFRTTPRHAAYRSAMFWLRPALAELFIWRAGRAYDVFQADQNQPAKKGKQT